MAHLNNSDRKMNIQHKVQRWNNNNKTKIME